MRFFEANPLNHKRTDIHVLSGSGGILAAHQPLVVPMLLRLSRFILNGYVVLVVSKQKGITIVFKTDPLQNVDVNSTFDSIAVIQKYIQHEIEGQLREMFREDLPSIIHRLSQRWIAGRTRVETPYISKSRIKVASERTATPLSPLIPTDQNLPKHSSSSSISHSALNRSVFHERDPSFSEENSNISFNDDSATIPHLENFGAIYGLRSDNLPRRASYSNFKKLFTPLRGLADLAEGDNEANVEWQEGNTFDAVSWDETHSIPSSTSSGEVAEFETLPAIGGGMVTRPRIYYSQSSLLSRSATTRRNSPRADSTTTSPFSPRSTDNVSFGNNDIGEPGDLATLSAEAASVLAWRRKEFLDKFARMHVGSSSGGTSVSESEMYDGESVSPSLRIPTELRDDTHHDRLSTIRSRSFSTSTRRSDNINIGSPPKFTSITDQDGKSHIVLRPGMSNSISHLTTLSHSNHTMSPFTRSFEHFTVRSVPHKPPASNSTAGQLTKARRRRIYHLKTAEVPVIAEEERRSSSPLPPSEFEVSDIEHYFQSPPSSVRRRPSYQSL